MKTPRYQWIIFTNWHERHDNTIGGGTSFPVRTRKQAAKLLAYFMVKKTFPGKIEVLSWDDATAQGRNQWLMCK